MMTTVVTRGAASAQALGYASSSASVNYVEDVFSTYLYTGNGSTQTITTGVDTGTKGGLIWVKKRSATDDHALFDSVRASGSILSSNLSDAATAGGTRLALTSTGFDLQAGGGSYNQNGFTYASWTFRKQPKFFDVVTYTGTGAAQNIAHNLGSVPGCVIVKRTDSTGDWWIWHRSATNTSGVPGEEGSNYTFLQFDTDASARTTVVWNGTNPTSTVFTVGGSSTASVSGATYVAYLFAHDAGGFGLTGTDNVISCGSFTRTFGTANSVNIGYEPQWVLIKCTSQTDSWQLYDTMRGLSQTASLKLEPNSTNPDSDTAGMKPTATGFDITATGIGGGTFIYIAIRRGPMKVPTDATKVFSPIANSNSTGATNTTGFPVDLQMWALRGGYGENFTVHDRLRGVSTTSTQVSSPDLVTSSTAAEKSTAFVTRNWNNTGFETPSGLSGASVVYENFRRAPGFFDEVCYTGTGAGSNAQTHNLGAVPELIITKLRSGSAFAGVGGWGVYAAALGATNVLELNLTTASAADNWFNATPTATTFYVFGNDRHSNISGGAFVAYLFATCPGVSKVGSYTGTGTTLQINCGFTAGSRFVLIKRTDSTGDWYVWDSARGIVAGNDPFLLLNSTAAENTSTDYVDTYSAGFEISSTAPAAINANGGTFIFLAIA
jgi:hypothetical protein